ncbi:hypothetical protein M9458_018158, partial [Cirrhinus mrigala]
MSRLMADLCRLLRVKQIRTTVFPPQTDGLVERFNQTQGDYWTSSRHLSAPRSNMVMPLVREHLTKAQQSQQRIYNRAAQPREFQPGDRVMVLVPTSACKFLTTWQGPYTVIEQLTALASVDPVVIDMGDHLSAAQKTELNHLVSQFSDVFSMRPGQTNIIQHDIRTPPGVIVRQRPYRVPEARRQAIEDEISDMLKLGVIEPSRSAWSSPIVMVPKPDFTLRFCNDFRRLNEVSDCSNVWGGPGSSQPSTSQKDIGKENSLLHPQWALPFGLHGAPATFQRMMDIILRPHQSYAAAYLDDVVIHSETWQDHLERLRRVLLELRRAGLTANPRKCHLALAEAQYLGAPPNNQDPGTSLFGVGGILSLISPDRPDQEGAAGENLPEHQDRSHYRTVLRAPDFNCPFLLQTDASDTGLGAVLSQVRDGEEHPATYISRKLTPAETRYAAVEKEALAIKWAVLELRYYLLGRRFTLITDHAPLQWMARARDTNARVSGGSWRSRTSASRWSIGLGRGGGYLQRTPGNKQGPAGTTQHGPSRHSCRSLPLPIKSSTLKRQSEKLLPCMQMLTSLSLLPRQ